jgi:hypothetical protein
MNISLNPSLWAEPVSQPLAERILDAFPSGSYALTALLRLVDIVETTDVATAAVECCQQPRLLINPEFVARHAATSERLIALVMHELHHVLLGHTTLFPRITKVQNFVFDAVINGVVCRMFPQEAYTSLFTGFYDAASFPQCLLRPPPGWPAQATVAPGILNLPEPIQTRVREVHVALYSSCGATYKEVFDALPSLLSETAVGSVPLFGGHEEDNAPAGTLEQTSPVIFDIVRDLVEQWPQPPDPIQGRSLADLIRPSQVEVKRPPSRRAILRGLIRKVAGIRGHGTFRERRTKHLVVPSPIPALTRRSIIQRALGTPTLLYEAQTQWQHTIRAGERVHVYLDVSGSMDAVKGALYGAVLDCEELVYPSVHLFSTRVSDITLTELRRGVCKSTGGTDITCVAAHVEANRVHRALLLTDGWVGTPKGHHHQILSATKLAVAFLGTNTNSNDLAAVADYTNHLIIGD